MVADVRYISYELSGNIGGLDAMASVHIYKDRQIVLLLNGIVMYRNISYRSSDSNDDILKDIIKCEYMIGLVFGWSRLRDAGKFGYSRCPHSRLLHGVINNEHSN